MSRCHIKAHVAVSTFRVEAHIYAYRLARTTAKIGPAL